MKRNTYRLATGALTTVLILNIFTEPMITPMKLIGFASGLKVILSASSTASPIYNAIAQWDPVKQNACLYSATTLNARNNSSEPWVKLGNCNTWTPPINTEPGIYDITWDAGKSRSLLVISSPPSSRPEAKIAALVPDYTWQAYNLVKGGSFYFESAGKKSENFSGRKLNLLRPLNFISVGDPKNYPTTPQVFPKNNPISFLREHYGRIDVIAQSQLDEQAYDLSAYRTLVLYGHDEYWTTEIKSSIESAVSNGTSLLNLSGNTGYRKLVRSGQIVGFDPATTARMGTSRWGDKPGDTKPTHLIGAEYLGEPFNKRSSLPISITSKTFKGLVKDGLPKQLTMQSASTYLKGMMVKSSHNPLFSGTGLKTGDFFGIASHVMSVEVDAVPETAAGAIEPEFLNKFSDAPINIGADVWLNARKKHGSRAWRAGTLIRTTYGKGKVFTAGPVGWVTSIVAGDCAVTQITVNALRWLGEPPLSSTKCQPINDFPPRR